MGLYEIKKSNGEEHCPQNNSLRDTRGVCRCYPKLNLYKPPNQNFTRRHASAPVPVPGRNLDSRTLGPQPVGQPLEVHCTKIRQTSPRHEYATNASKHQPRPHSLSLSLLAYQNPTALNGLRSRWNVLGASRSKPTSS